MKEYSNSFGDRQTSEPVVYLYSSFFKKMAILALAIGVILGIILGAVFQVASLEEILTATYTEPVKSFNVTLMLGTWAGFAVVSALLATVSCHFKNQETEIELLQDIRNKMKNEE